MLFLFCTIFNMNYPFKKIEKKWQEYWLKNKTFKAEQFSERDKFYILDMFPYPSGAGLHVGHPLGYIASDIIARYKRNKGFNVLHPQGYDSFGLPTEQYAIQTGQHPAVTTEENIKRYRYQLDRMGFSFDWDREIRTSEPGYYKWTQWIFSLLFNSWYDTKSDRARSIKELSEFLEKNGTKKLYAYTNEDYDEISSKTWLSSDEKFKQEFILKFRLAYLSDSYVNWCPGLGTVLANDEVVNGLSERGGYPVEIKKMKQWKLRVSSYAQRLLNGLEEIDWPEPLKEMQKNWIGQSHGARVKFKIKGSKNLIEVFTTRPDTIYGVTFLTLAPEHKLVKDLTTKSNLENVSQYISKIAKKNEKERLKDVGEISGVFTGTYAIHPFTNKKIPIWISEYVLVEYGTGAIMGVPCGDQRDHDFAKFFKIPITNIFKGVDVSTFAYTEKETFNLINSGFLNGLGFNKAFNKAVESLENINAGKNTITYKIRDAVFSRQRYWGEPIPIYYKNDLPYLIPKEYYPVKLPEITKYLPTEDGHPPLGNSKTWAWDTLNKKIVDNKKIDFLNIFPIEKNTMPGWAGSSWYFNRYMDPNNDEFFVDKSALDYWKDVDIYIGGTEHSTGHLIYSRFYQYFLYDLGYVPSQNFAKKMINQGMILGESAIIYKSKKNKNFVSAGIADKNDSIPLHVDIKLVNEKNQLNINEFKNWQEQFKNVKFELENGKFFVDREIEKMSKSKFNVVNPDQICDDYGADTLRMYEMFLGTLEQSKPWNTAGITGVYNFLNKFWRLFHDDKKFCVYEKPSSIESLKILHKTIKKVNSDIDSFSLNTSVSAFMIAVNELSKQNCKNRDVLEPLVILMSPFAPHICEELWFLLGNQSSVSTCNYPIADEKYLVNKIKNYPISFNGKMSFNIEISIDLDEDEIKKIVLSDNRANKYLGNNKPKKIIVVINKIINIVC